MHWLLLVFAVVAGVMLPIQAGLNAWLGRGLGHPVVATFASFLIGSVALAFFCVAIRVPWPTLTVAGELPWWTWTGGLLGACYLLLSIILAPKLGATTLFAAVIAGQLAASLLLDHFGLVGFAVHPLNFWRIAGVALIAAGVALVRTH